MPQPQVTGNIIGKRVKKQREAVGMTQVQLAAAMCVDYNYSYDRVTISRIEQGSRRITDKELCHLAKLLETTPHWLLGWK